MSSDPTQSTCGAAARKIAEAKLQFKALVEEMDLQSGLRSVDAVSSLGSFSIKIGFRAGNAGKPARHFVQVPCQKTPRALKLKNVCGWKKIQGGAWWEYSAAGKTCEVYFAGRDAFQPQVVVGSCITVKDASGSGTITHGLVVHDPKDGDMPWALNVGHGFVNIKSTDASNQVLFCNATEGRNQCQYCETGQCNASCKAVARSIIASGEKDIISMWPMPDLLPDGWIDFATFRIPKEHKIMPLILSAVKSDLSTLIDTAARDRIVAMDSVSSTYITIKDLEVLLDTQPEGVFLFKKGKASGWTYGRLSQVLNESIAIKPLGRDTLPGDCGSVWFVIDNTKAWPVAYHNGTTVTGTDEEEEGIKEEKKDNEIETEKETEINAEAYETAWTAFSKLTGINPIFKSEENYLWSV